MASANVHHASWPDDGHGGGESRNIHPLMRERYTIEKKPIGTGGFGEVFVARDKDFDRQVVIKKAIKTVAEDTPQQKILFKRESDIMKSLDHPNICKLLELYEDENQFWLVMEFCSGREVFAHINEKHYLSEETAADIVQQTGSALGYAHKKGIAHRDIKPENIVFCAEWDTNQVKVIDWGLSYFGNNLRRMTSNVGSLSYMAPEVFQAEEGYSSACDVWSLGVTTYVMLCGKPPFWGGPLRLLEKMQKGEYPMKDAPWPRISEHARDFVSRTLQAKPSDRLSIEDLQRHPWLVNQKRPTHVHRFRTMYTREVLTNMKTFSTASMLYSLCAQSVARQLDHRQLRDVDKVFRELDTNGDGQLSLVELTEGFERVFGKDSEQAVLEIFRRMDIDGSGTIDYTEFCAAGIGEGKISQDQALWSAFRTFDQDQDGKIKVDKVQNVCAQASQSWVREFDVDGDGCVDYSTFAAGSRSAQTRMGKGEDSPEDKEGREGGTPGYPRSTPGVPQWVHRKPRSWNSGYNWWKGYGSWNDGCYSDSWWDHGSWKAGNGNGW